MQYAMSSELGECTKIPGYILSKWNTRATIVYQAMIATVSLFKSLVGLIDQ